MWHLNDIGWGWWVLMSIGMVGFWALVVYGAFVLIRGSSASRQAAASRRDDSREPPLVVLDRRLAAGGISVEEYDRLREKLCDARREPAELTPQQ